MKRIEDFIAMSFECQICGTQGDVESHNLTLVLIEMQKDGWGMIKYNWEPEELTRLACKRCMKDVPTIKE